MSDKENLYITYPADGTKKSVDKGKVVIDFYNGKVKLPDGTNENISDNLKNHNLELAHSLMVEVDKDAKYSLDNGGSKPIGAGNVQNETYQDFAEIIIETSQTTQIAVWACTNPAATISIMKR